MVPTQFSEPSPSPAPSRRSGPRPSAKNAAAALGSLLAFAPVPLGVTAQFGVEGARVGGALQDPTPAERSTPPVPDTLQSLPLLLTEGVWAVASLQTSTERPAVRRTDKPPSTVARTADPANDARLVANVRDARFGRDGRLLALVIEAPDADRAAAPLRVLPATAVRWDEPRHRWLVAENDVRFTDLERADAPAPEHAPGARPYLAASRLVRASLDPKFAATLATLAAAPTGESKADQSPLATRQVAIAGASDPLPSIWLAPAAKRLVVMTVPMATNDGAGAESQRQVPVPWALVRADAADGDELQLALSAPAEVFASAPACAHPSEKPFATLRRRSYEHFGVAVPAWDRPALRGGTK